MVTGKGFIPRYGARRWLVQRLTGLVIAALVMFLSMAYQLTHPDGFEGWKSWLASNTIRLAFLLLLISLCVHAWIGIRDVLIDYVKPERVSLLTRKIVALTLIGEALWAVKILWSI